MRPATTRSSLRSSRTILTSCACCTSVGVSHQVMQNTSQHANGSSKLANGACQHPDGLPRVVVLASEHALLPWSGTASNLCAREELQKLAPVQGRSQRARQGDPVSLLARATWSLEKSLWRSYPATALWQRRFNAGAACPGTIPGTAVPLFRHNNRITSSSTCLFCAGLPGQPRTPSNYGS